MVTCSLTEYGTYGARKAAMLARLLAHAPPWALMAVGNISKVISYPAVIAMYMEALPRRTNTRNVEVFCPI